jgi:hypothetical protein
MDRLLTRLEFPWVASAGAAASAAGWGKTGTGGGPPLAAVERCLANLRKMGR